MLAKMLNVRIFDVEASSRCNLHCRFCPREALPDEGLMSDETFDRFLDWTRMGRTDTLSFVGMGEPTLNPRLSDFIRRAKTRYPKVNTWVTSNGATLNESKFLEVAEAGLDILDVSFNGMDSATYEREMRGANFDRTLANLERAAELIRRRSLKTRLQINYVVCDGTKDAEATIQAFWRKRGIGDFRPQRLHNRGGLARTDAQRGASAPGLGGRACQVHALFTFVDWHGNVLHCCHDARRRWPLGNVGTCSWREIQSKKKRVQRRKAWPAMCAACTDHLRFEMERTIRDQAIEGARHQAYRLWMRAGQRLFCTRPRENPISEEIIRERVPS